MIAVFNPANKQFLFFTEKIDNHIFNNFLIKEYSEHTDLTLYDYIGDFDVGQLYNVHTDEYASVIQSNISIIHESELKQKTHERIVTKHGYDVYNQLNIIREAVFSLNDQWHLFNPEFTKMHTVITAELNHMRDTIAEYKDDPETLFVTEQEEKDLSLMQPPLSL